MAKVFEKKELKKKSENLSDWYTDVVLKAELADYGPAKGTMVIRPYGYAIWERLQHILDTMFKEYGVVNAYFPLFIPYSFLEKEKEHMKGFSPELAIVTHGGGEKLKEPLVVRPTSETIMYHMYAKWIQSYRDLPVLINQWNNVVRWEMRTYLFLRTTEFLWQEGHTAHETEVDAIRMQEAALAWYQKAYEEYYAVPVIAGIKSNKEKFAGAKTTYTVEALMPDGKALQGATSHNLGQNFSKVFDIKFQNRKSQEDFAWQTSWGFSTRSLGGLFLVHGDDQGLILPPNIAPMQVIVMPIRKSDLSNELLDEYVQNIKEALLNGGVRVKVDAREEPSVGRRFNEWEVKGIPVRFEIGHKEAEDNTVTLVRRDTGEKTVVKRSDMLVTVEKVLKTIQDDLFEKAKTFRDKHTHEVSTYDEFKKIMETSRGFIKAFWCENAHCETAIKEETKASTRCLPLEDIDKNLDGVCVKCGAKAIHKWLFAQAY
ncbi:proline--tRNA ligase [Candidatus Gottesmanbacteria bacterium]|nr:proline--tRNA ligase [Candidatus Gottesmanbacteria bacterium]